MPGARRTPARPAAAGERPPPPLNWTHVSDAAYRLGVHRATVYRWCLDGEVVAKRFRRVWRVRLDSDGFPLMADAA